MSIVEQLARFLARRLGLPFEGGDPGGAVFFGYMPPAPARAVGVLAAELRAGGDDAGTRVRVVVRADDDGAWPLEVAARVVQCLDGQRDVMFVPGGDYVHRVQVERGFEFNGVGENDAQYYTAQFLVYACRGCP